MIIWWLLPPTPVYSTWICWLCHRPVKWKKQNIVSEFSLQSTERIERDLFKTSLPLACYTFEGLSQLETEHQQITWCTIFLKKKNRSKRFLLHFHFGKCFGRFFCRPPTKILSPLSLSLFFLSRKNININKEKRKTKEDFHSSSSFTIYDSLFSYISLVRYSKKRRG